MKRRFRWLLVGCVVGAMLGSTALAKPAKNEVLAVDVLEYGLYSYDSKNIRTKKSGKSQNAVLSNIRLVGKTTDVAVKDNTFFGVQYLVKTDLPRTLLVEILLTLPSGEVRKGAAEIRTNSPAVSNLVFGENDAPGEYGFAIKHKDAVLYETTLKVRK